MNLLYSKQLTQFCKVNRNNIEISKIELEIQKYNDLIEKEKLTVKNNVIKESKKYDNSQNNDKFSSISTKVLNHDNFEGPCNKFCYLCTTMEEHRSHLKTKKKIHGKRRPKYEVPIPFVPEKPIVKEAVKKECLYKIEVKTGSDLEAGSAVAIYISLYGTRNKIENHHLTKKYGSLTFQFNRDSKEIFFIKGPNVGVLKEICLEHNSGQKKDSWFVEYVIITCCTCNEKYLVKCDKWLSMWKGDLEVKRYFNAKFQPEVEKHFQVVTFTGDHISAEPKAKVYITFYGSKGKSSKLVLRNDDTKAFKSSQKDSFELTCSDIGYLRSIRLELANRLNITKNVDKSESLDFEPRISWLLDRVVVKDLDTGQQYEFDVFEWLGDDGVNKKLYKDLKVSPAEQNNLDKNKSTEKSTEKIQYEIKFYTGDKQMSGTDATVHCTIIGSHGCTSKMIFEDREKKLFETNSKDTFRITDVDVGQITHVKVGHSNDGKASGWYLDKVIVKKFFSKSIIFQYLKEMKYSGNMPQGLVDMEGKIQFKEILQNQDTSDEDNSDEEERWGDEIRKSVGQILAHKKKSYEVGSRAAISSQPNDDSSDSSDNSDSDEEALHKKSVQNKNYSFAKPLNAARVTLPFAEEYTFACRKWLAIDEDDKKTERRLGKTSSQLLSSEISVRVFENIPSRTHVQNELKLEHEKRRKRQIWENKNKAVNGNVED